MKRFSEEESRQREREERSRQRIQRQGYREAQHGQRDEGRYRGSREAHRQRRRSGDNYDMYGYYADYADRKEKRGKKRKVWLIVLLVLAVIVAGALVAHKVLVRPPEVPGTTQANSEGIHPGLLGAGRKEGVYTFLLVGRDDGGGGNTDTIMVGCFDTQQGTLDVLSIFRDTLVDVPWEIKKINSVYNRNGIEGLLDEVKDLIGYKPDYYFVVELDAVEELVDAIGGVDYDVPYNMDYEDFTQDLYIHFQKGQQHLDGEDAVRLLRWRKNNMGESLSVGDIGRVEVQQSFLKAVASQMVRLGNLPKLRQIASIVDKNLTSNLNYGEMIWFGEKALGMATDGIRFHSLPGDYTGSVWSNTYKNYQSYVFADATGLLELVNQFMNPYLTQITTEMQHVITGSDVGRTGGNASSSGGSHDESDVGTSDVVGTGNAAGNNTSNSTKPSPKPPENEPGSSGSQGSGNEGNNGNNNGSGNNNGGGDNNGSGNEGNGGSGIESPDPPEPPTPPDPPSEPSPDPAPQPPTGPSGGGGTEGGSET